MATYDLEEQEQLEELKTWWKLYGNWVMAFMLALAVAAISWQAWHYWRHEQAKAAALLFGTIQDAVAAHDAKKARDAAGTLIAQYPRQDYAVLGALLAARTQTDADDKTVDTQLAWAIDHADNAALRDLARLRLAARLLDSQRTDEALQQLHAEPIPEWAPRFLELKGDICAARGDMKAARSSWQQAADRSAALSGASPGWPSEYTDMLRTKINMLSEASS
jgi:predicted negative regulator of RcsB-dependent stress response